MTYGPMSILAWNAVSTKINERGQVEGTCVGTGMAFDPLSIITVPSMFLQHMDTDQPCWLGLKSMNC